MVVPDDVAVKMDASSVAVETYTEVNPVDVSPICVTAGPEATAVVGVEEMATFAVALVAVICKRSVDPTSAAIGRYVGDVAPEMAAQFPPALSQRIHCNTMAGGGLAFQPPAKPLRTRLSVAVPVTDGATSFTGAAAGCTPGITTWNDFCSDTSPGHEARSAPSLLSI